MPPMKARTGFIIGAGVGYVLGAKAGRERYEQLKGVTAKIAEREQVQTALEATVEPRSRIQLMISDQLRAASRTLRANA